MSNKQFRNNMRIVHLLTAVVVGTFIYSPWSADPTFAAAVRFIVLPLLSLTGLIMWQQARLGKWIRQRTASSSVS
ncbi:MAG: hypothetical protein SF162_16800 [bacterium]|nr:hypothetical protein [bacterium]